MTREIENELKQRFADLDEDLPVADFTTRVMTDLLEPRRRERLVWFAILLATLAFLWIALPVIAAGFRMVAGFPRIVSDVAGESWAALSRSPLIYVYGAALGGYVLIWLTRRLRIRLM